MASKRSSVNKPLSLIQPALSWKETFQQAWNLFVFSAIFSVLFNAFYSNGIELKAKPIQQPHLQDILKNNSSSPVYTGWKKNTPAVKPSSAIVPTELPDNLPRLSLAGAKNRFDNHSALFLDARSPDEYKEGHIPGAWNFYADDFDKFAPQVLPKLTDKGQEIIAYCHGSSCELSIHLAQKLLDQGYTNVKVFFGGWPDWKRAQYPVNTGEAP